MTTYRPGTAPIKSASGPLREEEREAGVDIRNTSLSTIDQTLAVSHDAAQADPSVANDTQGQSVSETEKKAKGMRELELSASETPSRKRARGQNKGRTFTRTDDAVPICSQIARGLPCKFGESCRFGHDLCAYLSQKGRDIPHISPNAQQTREDWLNAIYNLAENAERTLPQQPVNDPVQKSLDFSTSCPFFAERGECPAGWKCRFLGGHITRESGSQAVQSDALGERGTGLLLKKDESQLATWLKRPRSISNQEHPEYDEVNWLSPEAARLLRSSKYTYQKAPAILAHLQEETRKMDPSSHQQSTDRRIGTGPIRVDYAYEAALAALQAKAPRGVAATEDALEEHANALRNLRSSDSAADLAVIKPAEKRRLNWRGELYLAPLTTTGNLPYRRICSTFGSDIHCGEMGLAESFTSGHASEWSLTRRWEGERIFGTQVCGSKPEYLVPAAEALAREVGSGLDFVDVNCGCPIDLVFNKGAGSALLDHANKLGRIVRGMSEALGEIPLTIKLRTGTSSKQTTHKIFARAQTEWGVGAITLHGRSRKQRYKNDADWSYIGTCARTLRESVQNWNESARTADEPEMIPVPIYGNGDVYGYRDYYEHMEHTGVDGQMIARGALIKPWIFTEIKEHRDWDISARERLDIVRQFADYGLTHWGADTQGVNTTRRFLCEMLSFTHRYIPLGILEQTPVRMNDRPPPFMGRDSLETLLSSPSSQDWVRISEMFLGKAPDNWSFLRTYTLLTQPNTNPTLLQNQMRVCKGEIAT
ncbi:tRNA-dihydrouridine(47) synthase [NAD(P)(+)] [Malassezia yamatoensis]|uniref:tRNA-dihydrouridine(47) synthase [NAD(P)(+)] n=1 Tax=Malassezia yamatoensis TaxID=253288 RepID=A0AAJ5YTY3_9BASI|nr:tRNA-dihydrouridine(47) synthase [NAD(P)(+)] [Malassezia yamatoensis]